MQRLRNKRLQHVLPELRGQALPDDVLPAGVGQVGVCEGCC